VYLIDLKISAWLYLNNPLKPPERFFRKKFLISLA
jgi:hypothetical protein